MKGTYTLIIACRKPFRTEIGKLGRVNVGKGYYLYTGSALGKGAVSLEGRLSRHLRAWKRRQWHVDYLSSSRNCTVKFLVSFESDKHLECSVNQLIMNRLEVEPVLPHAGSGDCQCEAHLVKVLPRMPEKQIVHALMNIYGLLGKPSWRCTCRVTKLLGLSPIDLGRRRERFE